MIDISNDVSFTKMKHIDPCNVYVILHAFFDIKKEFYAIKLGIAAKIRISPIVALKDTPFSHILNLEKRIKESHFPIMKMDDFVTAVTLRFPWILIEHIESTKLSEQKYEVFIKHVLIEDEFYHVKMYHFWGSIS